MKKIAVLLLSILFAIFIMGCATTEERKSSGDRGQWYYEQHPFGDKQLPAPGSYTMP